MSEHHFHVPDDKEVTVTVQSARKTFLRMYWEGMAYGAGGVAGICTVVASFEIARKLLAWLF